MQRWIVGTVVVAALGFGLRWAFLAARIQGAASGALKPLGFPKEPGWGDVKIPITSVVPSGDGFTITCLGSYDQKPAGLILKIAHFGPPDPANRNGQLPDIRFKNGGVIFVPQGEATTNLLTLISTLYEHPLKEFNLPQAIPLIAATLEGDPDRLETQTVKLKVFHGGDEGEDPQYFELYVNLHVRDGYVELAEKDPDYRLGVLRSFGAKL